MKCGVCKKECLGNITVINPNLKPSHIILCPRCFKLWSNDEYDKLINIIKTNKK